MIDPSLKRPQRRRVQRPPTATMRSGSPTAGIPVVLGVLLHAPQKRPRRRGFRAPVLSQLCAKTANACPQGR